MILALNKLEYYLLGAEFTLYTDHKPFKSLFTGEMKNARIQRWAVIYSKFNCSIKYRQGKFHANADALSRITRHTRR